MQKSKQKVCFVWASAASVDPGASVPSANSPFGEQEKDKYGTASIFLEFICLSNCDFAIDAVCFLEFFGVLIKL